MKLTFPDSDHPILARAIRAWETGDTRAPESTLDAARKELRAWRADHPSDASDAAAQKTVAETIDSLIQALLPILAKPGSIVLKLRLRQAS
jgi:hypothetical protein